MRAARKHAYTTPFPKPACNTRPADRRLQLRAFPFHFRLWLPSHPGSGAGTLVQARLFSINAIPWNIYTMLFQGFESISYFPYILPNGFGCSIFLASPFLYLLFRQGGRYKVVAWIAIAFLTLVHWCHGNPGIWQFSYRYAMVLLPWMFLLL